MEDELIICCVCEMEKLPSKEDPDFCQQCYDKIEGKNIMERTQAYRCYVDTLANAHGHKEREVGCALDLFFPEMPYSKRRKILKNLRED